MKRIAVTSRGIAQIRHLEALLGQRADYLGRWHAASPDLHSAVAGWGNKRSGMAARRMAARAGLPLLILEDGFLRSAGDGADQHPLSMNIDDLGIYFDAAAPSRLELLIRAGCTAAQAQRSLALGETWRAERLSKYNAARDTAFDATSPYVVVADQTHGDASIAGALAGPGSFAQMLEAALDEYPDHEIVLKMHPEVYAGRKRGHFAALSPGMAARVRVLGQHLGPADLLERASAVYVVSSQIGFEALIWQRRVRTFGMPFYAGWGLTHDALARPARPARRTDASLEALLHAALVAYPRYVDPETGTRCEIERVMEHVALQRRMRRRFPAQIHALGFSRWKKPIARAFFSGSELHFVGDAHQLPAGAHVATWGRPSMEQHGVSPATVTRIEDGFLRSVGLGAQLTTPLSWVQDDIGVYYDATQSSRLEQMLQNHVFDAGLLRRAAALRRTIVAQGASKYNLSGPPWRRPRTGRQVVLVTGQVESDASIRFGAAGIKTNLALLRAVRQAKPDAYLVYKAHPDVVAGIRRGALPSAAAQLLCDEVVEQACISDLLSKVDELHVLTSLTGFEALLRGIPVVTHGMPFYAGWGLTADRCALARRRRTLDIDQLAAAVLILYPTYVSCVTGEFTTPERALAELSEAGAYARVHQGRVRRWPVWLLRIAAEIGRRWRAN